MPTSLPHPSTLFKSPEELAADRAVAEMTPAASAITKPTASSVTDRIQNLRKRRQDFDQLQALLKESLAQSGLTLDDLRDAAHR